MFGLQVTEYVKGRTGKCFAFTWILLGCLPHHKTPSAYPPTPLQLGPTPSDPCRWRPKLLGVLGAGLMLATFAHLALLVSDLLP